MLLFVLCSLLLLHHHYHWNRRGWSLLLTLIFSNVERGKSCFAISAHKHVCPSRSCDIIKGLCKELRQAETKTRFTWFWSILDYWYVPIQFFILFVMILLLLCRMGLFLVIDGFKRGGLHNIILSKKIVFHLFHKTQVLMWTGFLYKPVLNSVIKNDIHPPTILSVQLYSFSMVPFNLVKWAKIISKCDTHPVIFHCKQEFIRSGPI